ncbi:MAG: hypothetical protein R3222_03475 [Balneolaceae bacterium]|nr:hypothetical protein [Balneolaceae bacterium]
MKLFTNFSAKILLLTLIAGLLTLSACKNPASSEEEEHENAVGAILITNGQEIVRIEEGRVVSGQIEVAAGEETTLISIYFLADDGDEFQPDEPDYSLRWSDIDTSIADVEQHAEDGKWGFHIHGEAQGNTSVVLRLWHDGEGHSDFDTPSIPVIVN